MYDVGCFIKPKSGFEIIKDVSSFMCNSNNKNSIYSYKSCLGSMIQSLFYVRIVPILSSKLSRTQQYQPAKLSGFDVEDKYNAPVFALSDIGWFYIASKSSNKDELLHNVESRLRKSNPKFNVYFGERLKNFELFHKYEWIFNDRFSFSIL